MTALRASFLACLMIGLIGACAREAHFWPEEGAVQPLPARLAQPLPGAWMAWLGPAPAGRADQLAWVQGRLNRVPFRTDRARWGVEDYWASPEEFLRGGGDCEDYALAKLAVLRALGWRQEDLRLVVVADMARGGRTHAVAEVRDGGTLWLLDNQTAGLRDAAAERRYLPLRWYGAQAR